MLYHAVDCMGCWLETCTVERKKCLTGISTDEVVAEVRAELEDLHPQPRLLTLEATPNAS